MSEYYTLPGMPSDLLSSEVAGERRLKTQDDASIDFTGARATIDELHWLGHRGVVFSLSPKVIVPANATVWLTGETDGSSVHLSGVEFSLDEGGVEIELREGVAATGGQLLTPVCRNRRSPVRDSTFATVAAPTVTDDGELLLLIGFPPAASPQARAPQSGDDNLEWVLRNGTKYGIKFTNLTSSPRTVYGEFSWYEPGLL